jgi:hypothetical protein
MAIVHVLGDGDGGGDSSLGVLPRHHPEGRVEAYGEIRGARGDCVSAQRDPAWVRPPDGLGRINHGPDRWIVW